MDDSPHEGGEASKNAHYFRPTSIATGLPWHVARRKRDRQLIAAAKKGLAVKGGIPLSSIGHSGGFLSPSSTGFGAGTEGEAEEQAGEVDISIDEALQRGADVNAADYNGNTALHYACEEGYVDVVEYLLQKKVRPSPGGPLVPHLNTVHPGRRSNEDALRLSATLPSQRCISVHLHSAPRETIHPARLFCMAHHPEQSRLLHQPPEVNQNGVIRIG